MLRTIVGVIVGWLIFAVPSVALFRLAGVEPYAHATAAFVAGSIVYGVAFALLGGYVAARIAIRIGAARAVGVVIAVAALLSLGIRPGEGAIWSQLAAFALMAPAAVIGGGIRMRQVRKSSAAQ